MRTKTVVALTLLAVALGLVAGQIGSRMVAFSRSGGVSEERLRELTRGACHGVLSGRNDPVLAVLRNAYDLKETQSPDLDIDFVGDCTFGYTLESDYRGIARVDFSADGDRVQRVRFYNRNDDALWDSHTPSFTASLFVTGNTLYVYDEFRGRLLATPLEDVSSYREIEPGVRRSVLVRKR